MCTFISPLEGSALHSAADSTHTDNIVLRGVEVCYQHFSVGFGYYNLPLLPTWKTDMKSNGQPARSDPHINEPLGLIPQRGWLIFPILTSNIINTAQEEKEKKP